MNHNDIRSSFKHPLRIVFYLLFFLFFVAILSFVVMFLWNKIVVEITNVKPISYWQSAGLLLLFKILFGFGFNRKHRYPRMKKHWHWKEKWMNMSEEERQAFKAKWKEKCNRRND